MQAAAKVPTKARSKRGAHIVRQMSELCALDAEELHPPSSAGGSNASTQYDTPASKRAKLDDAPDAAHDSVASGVEPPGVPSGDVASDSLPSPASEDPARFGSGAWCVCAFERYRMLRGTSGPRLRAMGSTRTPYCDSITCA